MKSKSKGEDQCEGGKEGGSELGGRRLGDKGGLLSGGEAASV